MQTLDNLLDYVGDLLERVTQWKRRALVVAVVSVVEAVVILVLIHRYK